jgi:hypothetical protein
VREVPELAIRDRGDPGGDPLGCRDYDLPRQRLVQVPVVEYR